MHHVFTVSLSFFALLTIGAGCAPSSASVVENPSAQVVDRVPAVVAVQAKSSPEIHVANLPAPTVGIPPEIRPLEIALRAGSYFFEPTSIVAVPGQLVQIMFATSMVADTFVIDGLGVTSKIIEGKTLQFTAPLTPGRWSFYSSTGAHRDLGMQGVFIVEE